MIHITEEKLKAAIQICLGGDSIYTEEREAKLVHDIKALSIAGYNRLKIEPMYDGISTAVTQYKVTDDLGVIWMQGTRDECERYLYGR